MMGAQATHQNQINLILRNSYLKMKAQELLKQYLKAVCIK